MPRVSKVTRERVFRAIREVELSAQKVTAARVRAAMGDFGCNSTICAFIKEWQIERLEEDRVRRPNEIDELKAENAKLRADNANLRHASLAPELRERIAAHEVRKGREAHTWEITLLTLGEELE